MASDALGGLGGGGGGLIATSCRRVVGSPRPPPAPAPLAEHLSTIRYLPARMSPSLGRGLGPRG